VGSEMCIRDSAHRPQRLPVPRGAGDWGGWPHSGNRTDGWICL